MVLLMLLFSLPASAQPTTPGPGVRTLSAEDLRQAGITRLGELFRLLDDWDAATIDGYTWQAAAAGLTPLQGSTWTLLVDGQPVDLGLLDTPVLNMLPLPLSEVAYVEVISRPALVAGTVAPTGTIHLHTRLPEDGASLRGTVSAANEIGDPGPYRYTDFATPNIDRIGPTYEASAAWARNDGHARAFIKADEHHATDEQIEDRVRTLFQGIKKPRMLLMAPGLDLRITRLGQHRLYAGFSRLQDLRFVEPLGLEVPTDHRWYHVGLQGNTAPQRPSGLRYQLGYTVSDLDPRPTTTGIELILRQDRLRANAEGRIGTNTVGGSLGLTFQYLCTVTAPELEEPSLLVPLLYGRLTAQPSSRLMAQLTGYAHVADGDIGHGLLLTVQTQPHPQHTLSLTASALRQPYALTNSLWFWMARGYRLPTGPTVNLPAAFPSASMYTVDLAWTLRPSARFRLTLAGAYRRHLGQTVALYDVRYDASTSGFETVTTVQTYIAGTAWQGRAEAVIEYTDAFSQRWSYRLLRYPAENDAFFRAWRSLPWHQGSTTLRLAPSPRFSLYGRLSARSNALWTDYGRVEATTNGRYPEELSPFWLLDLTAQKRLWNDHLRLSLSLRNFLSEDVRWHPAGEIQQMMFHVSLEAYVGTGR